MKVVSFSQCGFSSSLQYIGFGYNTEPKDLFELFQACFDSGIIPSWRYNAIIKPIPKSSKKAQWPHDYRGINSTVYKLYPSFVIHLERIGVIFSMLLYADDSV